MVDEVIIFNELNLEKILRLVKPNLLVRGADYSENLVRKETKFQIM